MLPRGCSQNAASAAVNTQATGEIRVDVGGMRRYADGSRYMQPWPCSLRREAEQTADGRVLAALLDAYSDAGLGGAMLRTSVFFASVGHPAGSRQVDYTRVAFST